MDEGKKYYTIGSVEKVCDLLDTLSKKSSWELNELATEIGLPKTSVHRFLLTLADKGFVVQEKRRGSPINFFRSAARWLKRPDSSR